MPERSTMQREIEAQSVVLPRSVPLLREAAASFPTSPSRILAGGCGDSFFAAELAQHLFRSVECDYRPVTAQDLLTAIPPRDGDFVLLASVSGSTRRTVEAARHARRHGAAVGGITCNSESPLANESDYVLVLPYEPLSRATPHTLDFTMSLLALHAVAERLGGHALPSGNALRSELDRSLREFDRHLSPLVPAAWKQPEDVRVHFLGAGADQGLAAYGSAKLHEAGGLLALANETENFVHGPNFMLDVHDVVFLTALEPAGARRACEVGQELHHLGVHGILVQGGTGSSPCGGDDTSSFTVAADPAIAPYAASLAPQVWCLVLAERFGLQLEAPRAGRADGDVHVQVQRRWMKETHVTP